MRRQGLTSPNDRFYEPLLPSLFMAATFSFFSFLFLFIFFLSTFSSPYIGICQLKKRESKESRKYGDDNVVHNKVSTRARANVPPPPFSKFKIAALVGVGAA